jgi:hypothetical protein
MPSGPAQPPSPKRPQDAGNEDRTSAAADAQHDAELGVEERSGPLTITRVVKDDGRSLILYGHSAAQAELEDAAELEEEVEPEEEVELEEEAELEQAELEDAAAAAAELAQAEPADATASEPDGRDGHA